jgi:protease IV
LPKGRKIIFLIMVGGFIFLFLLFFIIGIMGMSDTDGGAWSGFGDKIAIVSVVGEIIESEQTVSQLRAFARNSSVKGILVRINSPGGVVGASQEIYDEILSIREEFKIPVVISMGSIAASGGYYIACAGDYIFANPGTLTGSIGVIIQYPVLKELMDKIGVQFKTIKTGAVKDVGSPFRWPNEADSVMLQAAIDNTYMQFVDVVSEKREIDRDIVVELADGSIYTGLQALQLDLIDTLGSMESAVSYLGELAGISGEPKRVQPRIEKDRTVLDLLTSLAEQHLSSVSDVGPQLMFLYR